VVSPSPSDCSLFYASIVILLVAFYDTSDPLRLRMGANGVTLISVSKLYYACHRHINLPLESLYLLKKPHQNPSGSYKDLSIHMARQREATLFYTML
jgi:hypothetical protein